MCNDDKSNLVSYLYDDLECRDELAAMRAVRADLMTWTPPAPEFAFRIVADRAADNVLRPDVAAWRRLFTPAAAFAAAAVLVLAAAAGLARIEVRHGADGWTLRTGSSPEAPADTARLAFAAHDVNLPADDGAFALLEQRISALETAVHDSGSGLRNASTLSARSSDQEILKVVHELLAQSESRQKGELALRIGQVIRDVDAQRVADLNRVQQGIGRIDATVADEAAAHRELMTYLLTSSKQK